MSTTALIISQETPRYSDNILNKKSCFDYPLSWNIVSGGINGTASNSTAEKYKGNRSIEITFTGTDPFIFNTGDSRLQITATKTGSHLLSWRFYKPNTALSCNFNVRVYVNGVLQAYNNFAQIVYKDDGYVDGAWTCYGQYISLNSGDDVDFEFEAEGDVIGAKLYFDGLKLEYKDRSVEFCSTYSLPLDITLEESQDIDVPNIVDGTTATVTATLTGAIVGDFVQMVYPVALITAGLEVGHPVVSAADTIKFTIRNNTGGDVNPADAAYTFKIVR